MRLGGMVREEIKKRLENGTAYLDLVVKGKWIEQPYDYLCSECGKSVYYFTDGYVDGTSELPNFCPFCGADMREGDANG